MPSNSAPSSPTVASASPATVFQLSRGANLSGRKSHSRVGQDALSVAWYLRPLTAFLDDARGSAVPGVLGSQLRYGPGVPTPPSAGRQLIRRDSDPLLRGAGIWGKTTSLLPCLPLLWVMGLGLILVSMDAMSDLDLLNMKTSWALPEGPPPNGTMAFGRRLLQEHEERGAWTLEIFAAPPSLASADATWRHRVAVGSWLKLVNVRRVVLLGSSPSLKEHLVSLDPHRVVQETHVDVSFTGEVLLHSMVGRARASEATVAVVVHPADTVLLNDFTVALEGVRTARGNWLLVASQWRLSLATPLAPAALHVKTGDARDHAGEGRGQSSGKTKGVQKPLQQLQPPVAPLQQELSGGALGSLEDIKLLDLQFGRGSMHQGELVVGEDAAGIRVGSSGIGVSVTSEPEDDMCDDGQWIVRSPDLRESFSCLTDKELAQFIRMLSTKADASAHGPKGKESSSFSSFRWSSVCAPPGVWAWNTGSTPLTSGAVPPFALVPPPLNPLDPPSLAEQAAHQMGASFQSSETWTGFSDTSFPAPGLLSSNTGSSTEEEDMMLPVVALECAASVPLQWLISEALRSDLRRTIDATPAVTSFTMLTASERAQYHDRYAAKGAKPGRILVPNYLQSTSATSWEGAKADSVFRHAMLRLRMKVNAELAGSYGVFSLGQCSQDDVPVTMLPCELEDSGGICFKELPVECRSPACRPLWTHPSALEHTAGLRCARRTGAAFLPSFSKGDTIIRDAILRTPQAILRVSEPAVDSSSMKQEESEMLPKGQEGVAQGVEKAVSDSVKMHEVLRHVSGGERMVVLTAAAYNYRDMLMSWACSLRRLHVTNFAVAALDQEVLEFALEQGLPVFDYPYNQVIEADNCHFGTTCFHNVTKVKSRLVLKVLKLGYSVLFSDTDVYWFRNPVPVLLEYDASHMVVQSDQWNDTEVDNDQWRLNSGFYLVRSEANAIAAMEAIVAHAAGSASTEQPSFYTILCGDFGEFRRGTSQCFNPKFGLTVDFLDRQRFPNGSTGKLLEPGHDVRRECRERGCFVLHNNWVSGRKRKYKRQVTASLWDYDEATRMCRHLWETNPQSFQTF